MKSTAGKDNMDYSERMNNTFRGSPGRISTLPLISQNQPNKAAELRDDIVLQENTNCRRLEEGSLLDKDIELGSSEQMDDEERLHFVQHKLSRVE